MRRELQQVRVQFDDAIDNLKTSFEALLDSDDFVDDRRAIIDHLSRTGGAASNRELAALIGKSDEWTRVQLVMLADAGLIARTHGPGAADAVRNTLSDGIVWPVGLSVEQCRVLSVPERVRVMDMLARDGR